MAKRRPANKTSAEKEKTPTDTPPAEDSSPAMFEHLGRRIDELTYVEEAERAVSRAKAELRKAQRRYHQMRHKAKAEIGELEQKNLKEIADDGLQFVRRNPGWGLGLAAAMGFFLGRLFRR